jgi:UDP-N-acetylmuramoyl-L-alanyl-D-glutamate--2,6-diaminopimelate ligase
MNLGELLTGAQLRQPLTPELAKLEVAGLEYDSRRVEKGFVFFAFAGSRVDGHEFAQEALSRGALAVVSELPEPGGFAGNWIPVQHGRQALSAASRIFYEHPDQRIAFTGITGTNGKTTPRTS